MSEILNLNDTTPAAQDGRRNILWQKGPSSGIDPGTGLEVFPVSASELSELALGWSVPAGMGVAQSSVGPTLIAPRAAQLTKAKLYVKASDPSNALLLRIRKNGTMIFSVDWSVPADTAPGTLVTNAGLTSEFLAVNPDDLFTLDIVSGSVHWDFSLQVES